MVLGLLASIGAFAGTFYIADQAIELLDDLLDDAVDFVFDLTEDVLDFLEPVTNFISGAVNALAEDPLHALAVITAIVLGPATGWASLKALPYINAIKVKSDGGSWGDAFKAGATTYVTQQVYASTNVQGLEASTTVSVTDALVQAGLDPSLAASIGDVLGAATSAGVAQGSIELVMGGSFSDGFTQGATIAGATATVAQINGYLQENLPDSFKYEGVTRNSQGHVIDESGNRVYNPGVGGADDITSPTGATAATSLQTMPPVVQQLLSDALAAELQGQTITSELVTGSLAKHYVTTEVVSAGLEKLGGVAFDSDEGQILLSYITSGVQKTIGEVAASGLSYQAGVNFTNNVMASISQYGSDQLFAQTLDYLDNNVAVQAAMNFIDGALRGNLDQVKQATEDFETALNIYSGKVDQNNELITEQNRLSVLYNDAVDLFKQGGDGISGAAYLSLLDQWNNSVGEDGKPESYPSNSGIFNSFEEFYRSEAAQNGYASYEQMQVGIKLISNTQKDLNKFVEDNSATMASLNNDLKFTYQEADDTLIANGTAGIDYVIETVEEIDPEAGSIAVDKYYVLGANNRKIPTSAAATYHESIGIWNDAQNTLMSDIDYLGDEYQADFIQFTQEDFVKIIAPSFDKDEYIAMYSAQIDENSNAFKNFIEEGIRNKHFISESQKDAIYESQKAQFKLNVAKTYLPGVTNPLQKLSVAQLQALDQFVDDEFDIRMNATYSTDNYASWGDYLTAITPVYNDSINVVISQLEANQLFTDKQLIRDSEAAAIEWIGDANVTENTLNLLSSGGIAFNSDGSFKYSFGAQDSNNNILSIVNPETGLSETLLDGISFDQLEEEDPYSFFQTVSDVFGHFGEALAPGMDAQNQFYAIQAEIALASTQQIIDTAKVARATALHFGQNADRKIIEYLLKRKLGADDFATQLSNLADPDNIYGLVDWSDEGFTAKYDALSAGLRDFVAGAKTIPGNIGSLGVQAIAGTAQAINGAAVMLADLATEAYYDVDLDYTLDTDPVHNFLENILTNAESWKSESWKSNAADLQVALQARAVDDPNTLANEAVWGSAELIGGAFADQPLTFLGEILFKEGVQEIVPALVGGGIGWIAGKAGAKALGHQVGQKFAMQAGFVGAAAIDIAESMGGTAEEAYDTAFAVVRDALINRNTKLEANGQTPLTITQIHLAAEHYAKDISTKNALFAGMATAATFMVPGKPGAALDTAFLRAINKDAFAIYGGRIVAQEMLAEGFEEGLIANNLEGLLAEWDPNRNVSGNVWFASTMGALVAGPITATMVGFMGQNPGFDDPGNEDFTLPTQTEITGRTKPQSTGNLAADVLLLTSPDLASAVYSGSADVLDTLTDLGIDYDIASSLQDAADDTDFTGLLGLPTLADNNNNDNIGTNPVPPDFSTFPPSVANELYYDAATDTTFMGVAGGWEERGRGNNTTSELATSLELGDDFHTANATTIPDSYTPNSLTTIPASRKIIIDPITGASYSYTFAKGNNTADLRIAYETLLDAIDDPETEYTRGMYDTAIEQVRETPLERLEVVVTDVPQLDTSLYALPPSYEHTMYDESIQIRGHKRYALPLAFEDGYQPEYMTLDQMENIINYNATMYLDSGMYGINDEPPDSYQQQMQDNYIGALETFYPLIQRERERLGLQNYDQQNPSELEEIEFDRYSNNARRTDWFDGVPYLLRTVNHKRHNETMTIDDARYFYNLALRFIKPPSLTNSEPSDPASGRLSTRLRQELNYTQEVYDGLISPELLNEYLWHTEVLGEDGLPDARIDELLAAEGAAGRGVFYWLGFTNPFAQELVDRTGLRRFSTANDTFKIVDGLLVPDTYFSTVHGENLADDPAYDGDYIPTGEDLLNAIYPGGVVSDGTGRFVPKVDVDTIYDSWMDDPRYDPFAGKSPNDSEVYWQDPITGIQYVWGMRQRNGLANDYSVGHPRTGDNGRWQRVILNYVEDSRYGAQDEFGNPRNTHLVYFPTGVGPGGRDVGLNLTGEEGKPDAPWPSDAGLFPSSAMTDPDDPLHMRQGITRQGDSDLLGHLYNHDFDNLTEQEMRQIIIDNPRAYGFDYTPIINNPAYHYKDQGVTSNDARRMLEENGIDPDVYYKSSDQPYISVFYTDIMNMSLEEVQRRLSEPPPPPEGWNQDDKIIDYFTAEAVANGWTVLDTRSYVFTNRDNILETVSDFDLTSTSFADAFDNTFVNNVDTSKNFANIDASPALSARTMRNLFMDKYNLTEDEYYAMMKSDAYGTTKEEIDTAINNYLRTAVQVDEDGNPILDAFGNEVKGVKADSEFVETLVANNVNTRDSIIAAYKEAYGQNYEPSEEQINNYLGANFGVSFGDSNNQLPEGEVGNQIGKPTASNIDQLTIGTTTPAEQADIISTATAGLSQSELDSLGDLNRLIDPNKNVSSNEIVIQQFINRQQAYNNRLEIAKSNIRAALQDVERESGYKKYSDKDNAWVEANFTDLLDVINARPSKRPEGNEIQDAVDAFLVADKETGVAALKNAMGDVGVDSFALGGNPELIKTRLAEALWSINGDASDAAALNQLAVDFKNKWGYGASLNDLFRLGHDVINQDLYKQDGDWTRNPDDYPRNPNYALGDNPFSRGYNLYRKYDYGGSNTAPDLDTYGPASATFERVKAEFISRFGYTPDDAEVRQFTNSAIRNLLAVADGSGIPIEDDGSPYFLFEQEIDAYINPRQLSNAEAEAIILGTFAKGSPQYNALMAKYGNKMGGVGYQDTQTAALEAEILTLSARANIESDIIALLNDGTNFDGGTAFDPTKDTGAYLVRAYADKIEAGDFTGTSDPALLNEIKKSVNARRYMADELAQDIKDELGLSETLEEIKNDAAYASLFNTLVDEDGTVDNPYNFQTLQEQTLDDATVSQAEARDYFRDILGYDQGWMPTWNIDNRVAGVGDEATILPDDPNAIAGDVLDIFNKTTVTRDDIENELKNNPTKYGFKDSAAVQAAIAGGLDLTKYEGKYWKDNGKSNSGDPILQAAFTGLAPKLDADTTTARELRNYLRDQGFDMGSVEDGDLTNFAALQAAGMSDALGFNTDLENTQSVIDYMDANEITGDEIRNQIVAETGVNIYEEDGVTLKAEFTDQALTNAGFLVDTKGRDGYQAAELTGNVADNTISESDIRAWLGNNDYAAPGAGADFSGYVGLGTDIAGQAGQYVTDEGLITQTQTTINNERQAVRDYFDTAHSYFDTDAAVDLDVDALRNADTATMQAAVNAFVNTQYTYEGEARDYLASLGLTDVLATDPDTGNYIVPNSEINNLIGQFGTPELITRAAEEGGYFDQNEVTFDEIREQIANELGVVPATLYDENGDPIAGYTDTDITNAGFTQGVNVAETGLGAEITDNVLTRSDIENHLLGLGYSEEQITNFDSSNIAWDDTTALDTLTADFQNQYRNATQQAIAADLATNFGWSNATDADIAAVADLDATGREAWVGDRRFTPAQADTALALQGITPESIGQARYDTLRNGLIVDQDRTGNVPATQAALVDSVEDPLLDPFFITPDEVATEFGNYTYFDATGNTIPTGLIDESGLGTTVEAYVNANYVTADEARAALDGVAGVDAYELNDPNDPDSGYVITDQQLLDAELAGQYVDTVENQALAGKVQTLTTDETEARDLLIEQGVLNPSAADIQNYMGFTPEAPTFTPTDIADLRYRGILEQFGTPAVYSDTETDQEGNPVLVTPATGIYAEIDSLRGQGLDADAIGTAISTYIGGLGLATSGDLSTLQTEIQDYIGDQGFFTGDATDIQRIVSDVIGKPAELVTQDDIDYVTSLYQTNLQAGPDADITYTPADLAYDVNNDGIINQTDIDTLNQLYAGQDAEYNQYVAGIDPTSQFADTGIFGTLAYEREQDRLADIARQEEIDAQTQANINLQNQIDAQRKATQEAEQRQLLTALAASQPPQQQMQQEEPELAEMGPRYDFSTIFSTPEVAAQKAAVSPYGGFRQKTAATGGLITNETDELLALLEEIE